MRKLLNKTYEYGFYSRNWAHFNSLYYLILVASLPNTWSPWLLDITNDFRFWLAIFSVAFIAFSFYSQENLKKKMYPIHVDSEGLQCTDTEGKKKLIAWSSIQYIRELLGKEADMWGYGAMDLEMEDRSSFRIYYCLKGYGELKEALQEEYPPPPKKPKIGFLNSLEATRLPNIIISNYQ